MGDKEKKMEDAGKDLSVKSLKIADEKIPEVSGRPPAEITEIAEEVAVETADSEQEAEGEAPQEELRDVERIPLELKSEFVHSVIARKYKDALKLAKIMVQFDPNSQIAKDYLPVLEERIAFDDEPDSDEAEEEESSSEESSSEESSSESEEEDLDAPGTSKDTIKPPRVRQCRTHETSYLDGFTKS